MPLQADRRARTEGRGHKAGHVGRRSQSWEGPCSGQLVPGGTGSGAASGVPSVCYPDPGPGQRGGREAVAVSQANRFEKGYAQCPLTIHVSVLRPRASPAGSATCYLCFGPMSLKSWSPGASRLSPDVTHHVDHKKHGGVVSGDGNVAGVCFRK